MTAGSPHPVRIQPAISTPRLRAEIKILTVHHQRRIRPVIRVSLRQHLLVRHDPALAASVRDRSRATRSAGHVVAVE